MGIGHFSCPSLQTNWELNNALRIWNSLSPSDFIFVTCFAQRATPPSVVCKCSKYVEVGVKRGQIGEVSASCQAESKLPSVSHKPPVLFQLTITSSRYLSCHDRRSEASRTTIVTILYVDCQSLWIQAIVVSSLVFWLMYPVRLKQRAEWKLLWSWTKLLECKYEWKSRTYRTAVLHSANAFSLFACIRVISLYTGQSLSHVTYESA